MKTLNRKRFKFGDLVKDYKSRLSIVTGHDMEGPDADWLAGQNSPEMRAFNDPLEGPFTASAKPSGTPLTKAFAVLWMHVQPLDGGALCVPDSLCENLGEASPDDFQKAWNAANEFGRDTLSYLPQFIAGYHGEHDESITGGVPVTRHPLEVRRPK